MAIPDLERKEIREVAQFLEKLGYMRTEDEYSIEYNSFNGQVLSLQPFRK